MQYPEIHYFIRSNMQAKGIHTLIDLRNRVNQTTSMGHEFLRQIANGVALPEVDKARAIAKVLDADPVEFLCLIENCRLKKRGLSEVLKVVPIK